MSEVLFSNEVRVVKTRCFEKLDLSSFGEDGEVLIVDDFVRFVEGGVDRGKSIHVRREGSIASLKRAQETVRKLPGNFCWGNYPFGKILENFVEGDQLYRIIFYGESFQPTAYMKTPPKGMMSTAIHGYVGREEVLTCTQIFERASRMRSDMSEGLNAYLRAQNESPKKTEDVDRPKIPMALLSEC